MNHRTLNTVFCAAALLASALPAAAQATYLYTGNDFTTLIGSFTAGQHVSATLQLSSWLPPNSSCVDVTTLPGFRLILSDGVNSLDTANIPSGGINELIGVVATSAAGLIAPGWELSILHSKTPLFQQIATAGAPQTGARCGSLIILPSDASFQNNGSFNEGEIIRDPGSWSFPTPASLVTMLLNEIQLGALPDIGHSLHDQLTQIAADISTNNGQACGDLRAFANHVRAQTGKKISEARSEFILTTVGIIESELHCG